MVDALEFEYSGLPPVKNVKLEGLWKPFDIFQRPWLAVGEAVGAARGEEDPFEAAWRGLKGYRRYPEIGYQFFPEAEEPGFQPGDLGAFVVNMALDPVNWIGPGLVKGAVKVGARAGARIGKYLLPEAKALLNVLGDAEFMWSKTDKIGAAADDLRTLGMNKGEAARHIRNAFPDMDQSIAPFRTFTDVTKPLDQWPEGEIDWLRQYLRLIEANYRPIARNSIQSAAQGIAQRIFMPMWSLSKTGGRSGQKLWKAYSAADNRTRTGHIQDMEKLLFLDKYQGGGKAGEKIRETLWDLRENPALTGPAHLVTDARRMGIAVDEHWKVLADYRDRFDNPLKTWNPLAKDGAGAWEPLADHFVENYLPWRLKPDAYKKQNVNKLKAALHDQGMSDNQINRIMANKGTKPKRIGHIDHVRLGGADHIKDPLQVLPKYFYETRRRMEFADEFGAEGELLDDLISNLYRKYEDPVTGEVISGAYDQAWAKKLGDLIQGVDTGDRMMTKVVGVLNSIQAVSKLGFATSMSNTSQIAGQYLNSGNLIKSLRKGGFILPGGKQLGVSPQAARLGAAAYNRGIRDDWMNLATGSRSWISDQYMKLIGFNWSERAFRHLGAVGGDLDASLIYKRYLATDPRTTIAKIRPFLREADPEVTRKRMLSELKRKFDISLDDPYAKYQVQGDKKSILTVGQEADLLGGELPLRVREHAGLRAADATMHAFGVMDLPLAWRTPTAKLLLQFKSYIYKQMGFLWGHVVAPGMKYMATDGKAGDIGPMMRSIVGVPIAAELTAHTRDVVKSIPSQIYSGVTTFKPADWDYKDPFWNDPDPATRVWQDLVYIGALGMMGDVIEAAKRGRLVRYVAGPSVTDITDYVEAMMGEMSFGKQVTRQLPGALGLPYSYNLFD